MRHSIDLRPVDETRTKRWGSKQWACGSYTVPDDDEGMNERYEKLATSMKQIVARDGRPEDDVRRGSNVGSICLDVLLERGRACSDQKCRYGTGIVRGVSRPAKTRQSVVAGGGGREGGIIEKVYF